MITALSNQQPSAFFSDSYLNLTLLLLLMMILILMMMMYGQEMLPLKATNQRPRKQSTEIAEYVDRRLEIAQFQLLSALSGSLGRHK